MMTTATEPKDAAPIHRIVVGIDGSTGGDRALEWAAAQAARSGAILEGHASYDPGYVFVSRDEVEMSLQKALDKATARVAEIAPGVTFKGVTHEGSPAKDLIDASKGADLLVVGSRGLGGFSGLFLGSVSQQCAVHAHCPIVIVRASKAGEHTKEGS